MAQELAGLNLECCKLTTFVFAYGLLLSTWVNNKKIICSISHHLIILIILVMMMMVIMITKYFFVQLRQVLPYTLIFNYIYTVTYTVIVLFLTEILAFLFSLFLILNEC